MRSEHSVSEEIESQRKEGSSWHGIAVGRDCMAPVDHTARVIDRQQRAAAELRVGRVVSENNPVMSTMCASLSV